MTEGHAILRWVVCSWHFDKNQASRPEQEQTDIREMKFCTDEGNLQMMLDAFENSHPNSNFLRLYGFGGSQAEPTSWSCAYVNGLTKTSMHIESWHNQLKHRKTGLSRQATIPQLLYCLEDMEKKMATKDEMIESKQRNIKQSYAMMTLMNHHPPTEWTLTQDKETKHRYSWKVSQDEEKIIVCTREEREKNGEIKVVEKERHLKPNRMGPCTGGRCLVKCRTCVSQHGKEIACAHSMTCDCYTYKRESLCKHLHMCLEHSPLPGEARSGCVGGVAAAGEAARRDHQYIEVKRKFA